MSPPFTVACIPAYNEEATIAKVIVEAMEHVDQVIVCDDGSKDSTAKIAARLGALVISHDRNYGYGASIASLIEKAREMEAGIMVTLDGDGQHNPSDIPALLTPLAKGLADITIGSRFKTKENPAASATDRTRDDATPAYRKFGISTITTISNAAHRTNLTDSQSGFRAYNERSIRALQVTEQGMGASIEILHKAQIQGLRIVEVPIAVTYGENTSTHNSLYHGIDLVMSTVKFISIDHPLRFYGIPGLCALVLSGFFMAWAFQIYSNEHRLVTNIALLGIGFLIIGIMFFTTSIILYVTINVIREPRRVTRSPSGTS